MSASRDHNACGLTGSQLSGRRLEVSTITAGVRVSERAFE
jgi:hypothetical protein